MRFMTLSLDAGENSVFFPSYDIRLLFQPHRIDFFDITCVFCWLCSHSLMCQTAARKPALDFSESVRA